MTVKQEQAMKTQGHGYFRKMKKGLASGIALTGLGMLAVAPAVSADETGTAETVVVADASSVDSSVEKATDNLATTEDSATVTTEANSETAVATEESVNVTDAEVVTTDLVEVTEEAASPVAEESNLITLSGTTATTTSSDVTVDETAGTITINAGGAYTVTGEAQNISIVIAETVVSDVYLTLQDAVLAAGNAAILSNAKKNTVYLILPEDSLNILSDSETNSNKGAIQVKGNLVIEGDGTLIVKAYGESAHAIKVGDELTITDATLDLTSTYKDGIHTDETVEITDAYLTITALAGDGIQAEDTDNTGDANKGNITINSGTVTVTADGQALQGTAAVTVNGGTVQLTSKTSEGIEGRYVVLNGGDVTTNAYDDGINATDWTTKSSYLEDGGTLSNGFTKADMGITINGGNLTLVSGGDGLDSNGFITINGGTTVVYSTGSSDGSSSALDHDGTATINGGEAWLISRYNGMIETFDGGTQAYVSANANGQAGSTITIKNSSGAVLDTLTATQAYASIIYSGSGLTSGQSYTVNNVSATATTSRQGGMGGMMGGFGQGGFAPGGQMGQPGTSSQATAPAGQSGTPTKPSTTTGQSGTSVSQPTAPTGQSGTTTKPSTTTGQSGTSVSQPTAPTGQSGTTTKPSTTTGQSGSSVSQPTAPTGQSGTTTKPSTTTGQAGSSTSQPTTPTGQSGTATKPSTTTGQSGSSTSQPTAPTGQSGTTTKPSTTTGQSGSSANQPTAPTTNATPNKVTTPAAGQGIVGVVTQQVSPQANPSVTQPMFGQQTPAQSWGVGFGQSPQAGANQVQFNQGGQMGMTPFGQQMGNMTFGPMAQSMPTGAPQGGYQSAPNQVNQQQAKQQVTVGQAQPFNQKGTVAQGQSSQQVATTSFVYGAAFGQPTAPTTMSTPTALGQGNKSQSTSSTLFANSPRRLSSDRPSAQARFF